VVAEVGSLVLDGRGSNGDGLLRSSGGEGTGISVIVSGGNGKVKTSVNGTSE
jgi:hypothetical protein